MKKIIAILLSLMLVILFVGCKDDASSSVQNDEQSKVQTSSQNKPTASSSKPTTSENKQTETNTKDLSDDQLAKVVARYLEVPEMSGITYQISEKFYWEAGGRYLKKVEFYSNANRLLAGASVDPTSGELMRDIYKYTSRQSLIDVITYSIESDYEAESKLDEYSSTAGMCDLHNKYTKKWKEIADEYYDKIMKYDEDIQLDDHYYSSDDLHTFVSNMKTSWEKYNKENCENYTKTLEAIYQGGSIVGPIASSHECAMQKEWALQLVGIYQQL